jgi:RecB family exonuclease
LEKEFKRDFQGYILEGKIDRIDTLENALSVIDYKSGKVPLISQKQIEKAVDFQLEFYYLLAKSLGDVEGVYYYELQSGMLTRESFLEEKLEKLSEILEEFKEPIREFPKCESSSPCVFCPYVILCGRE